jgi:hypothetical protein
VVLGEVAEIRGVERHQRNPVAKAARGDPGVVLRPGPPVQLGLGGQLAPQVGDPGSKGITGRPGRGQRKDLADAC